MVKKVFVCVTCFILIYSFCFISNKPLFYKYANEFNVYFGDSAYSNSLTVDKGEFIYLKNVKGESFSIDNNLLALNDLLESFNAKILITEFIEQGVSYYAYSPKIKYRARILGQTVNLHIFIGSQKTVVGAPLIYGSY